MPLPLRSQPAYSLACFPPFAPPRRTLTPFSMKAGRVPLSPPVTSPRAIFSVFAQVAASLTLLVVAGLFVRSLQKVKSFEVGFDSARILDAQFDPAQNGYSPAQTNAFYRDLESRVRAIPGVESAALASYVPMAGFPSRVPVYIEKNAPSPDRQPPKILTNAVDAPYFKTLGIPLLRGLAFTDSDDASAPVVAVINRTMAATYFPAADPLGKRSSIESASGPFIEIVGVVATANTKPSPNIRQPLFYVPLAQNFSSRRTFQNPRRGRSGIA